MRRILVFLTIISLAGCAPAVPDVDMVQIDITPPPIDSTEPPPPPPPPLDKPIAAPVHCDLKKYLSDKKIPAFVKDLYEGKGMDLDKVTPLPIFELFERSKGDLKAFYLRAIINSYYSADGYYTEALGGFGKQYLEKDPLGFAAFWIDTACFNDHDLETCADIVMLEMSILAEDDTSGLLLPMYLKRVKTASMRATMEDDEVPIRVIEKISEMIRKKWLKLQ